MIKTKDSILVCVCLASDDEDCIHFGKYCRKWHTVLNFQTSIFIKIILWTMVNNFFETGITLPLSYKQFTNSVILFNVGAVGYFPPMLLNLMPLVTRSNDNVPKIWSYFMSYFTVKINTVWVPFKALPAGWWWKLPRVAWLNWVTSLMLFCYLICKAQK